MSTKQNTTLRIDPDLKEKVSSLYKSLGLDLSTATSMFYIQSLRCHGLPFDVKIDDPNEATYMAIDDAVNNKNISDSFDTVDDLLRSLNAEDWLYKAI